MGWWYTLPHPAAPIFTCVLGWTLWLPGLQSEPNLLTTERGTWGVAAELTRSPSRSHNTDLHRPSSLYQLPDRLSRKGVFLTVFALLYPFLFPLWISIDCASVKKSLFYNFYLNSLQHKMNDYSKFPTKSAKSKWVSFECTNSVYQKAYHKFTHFESMHGAMQFHWGKTLVLLFQLLHPIHLTLGYQMNLKEEREKGDI